MEHASVAPIWGMPCVLAAFHLGGLLRAYTNIALLQPAQQLEVQRRRKEEAYVMVDAFRIAFEQQLRRGSEKVLQLAENDRQTPRHSKPEQGRVIIITLISNPFN
ncbi:hypothetical protein NFI96_026911 [Prochilodus magdalenae]|nr:hypothetical protein NFI96_026911 [Prochilodus magdalenae]